MSDKLTIQQHGHTTGFTLQLSWFIPGYSSCKRATTVPLPKEWVASRLEARGAVRAMRWGAVRAYARRE
jgi:hypothetical protein